MNNKIILSRFSAFVMTSDMIMLAFMLIALYMSQCLAKVAKVVVTGAAGRTGQLIFKRLLQIPTVAPVGIVKSQPSKQKLLKLGASDSQVQLGDITNPESLENAFAGADAVVLATSAVPKIKILSIIKIAFLKLFQQKTGAPEFTFPKGGDPYNVDWLGAKNTIDAAKAAGVKRFVFLSSMGGTQPDNFLNSIGKVKDDELSGDILLWKRKAEKYLIDSGLVYTIVHPGGLIDKPGGEREIVFGIDDQLLTLSSRSIPRADVAEVCVQALLLEGSKKRAFDVISKQPGEGSVTKDWKAFFAQKGNCRY